MKLIVTGGAGFIGSNFIHYWLKQHPGDKIVNLDALTYAGNLNNLTDLERNPNYSFVKGDICDSNLVKEITQGSDIIIHFAAESHVDRSILNSADFIRTNVEGTRVLLEAAKNYNLRFHHISTDEVFGALKAGDNKFNEKTPYDPHSPYSASKAASDHLVRAYFHTYNVAITISNCSNNYGPYQHPEKVIPLFITNLLEGKKVPLYGSGTNIRDWIHVNDHNRGIEAILLKGKIGETYCLGGNNEISNLELTNKLLEIMGKDQSSIQYVEDRPGHDWRYAIDCTKAKEELGWEPLTDFSNGLRETAEWYKIHGEWWRQLKK
ncbi:MAG: dTDP-glucose 4,6-dehydratase [Planctomycetes bacterium]|jgi:dTDP-glucose 4,6-dehydratase|nr:dTDP-glucose 4,6-dehydratase [Planctomycetota bacterium]